MKAWTTWVLVLATACGGGSAGDGDGDGGSEGIGSEDGTSAHDDDDDDDDDDDGDDDDDDDDGASTGTPDPDTGGMDQDTGEEGSTGELGLPSRVTWAELLPIAAASAANSDPLAELSLISGRGMQADGTIDLADLAADGKIEFRFSNVPSQTGVSVNFSVDSYEPDAMEIVPSSVFPVNGNGLVSDPLWDLDVLPSWAEVAQMFGQTRGCDGFTGSPDDLVSIRVDSFYPIMIVRAGTATAQTTADVPVAAFPPCM